MAECSGTNTIGGSPFDLMGWCPKCRKVQRLRVGTGQLIPHQNPYEEEARRDDRRRR